MTADAVRTAHRCDPLEPRRLLATLTIDGTAGDDTIYLSVSAGSILVGLNPPAGTVYNASYGDAAYDAVVVNGLGGGDRLGVFTNGDNTVRLDGGPGDDDLYAGTIPGSSTARLGGLTDLVTLSGGGGTDEAFLDDSDSLAAAVHLVGSTSYDQIADDGTPDFPPLAYDTVERVTVRTGGALDVVNDVFLPRADLFDVNLVGTDAGDRFHLGYGPILGPASGQLDGFLRPVFVVGGPGPNSLTISDRAATAGHVHTVTTNTYDRDGAVVPVTYSSVTRLTVAAGEDDADQFYMPSNGVSTTLDGRGGNDTFAVGAAAGVVDGNLDDVDFPVTIEAGAGNDAVRIDDEANPVGYAHSVSGSEYERSAIGGGTSGGGALTRYFDAESLVFFGSDVAADAIDVNGTANSMTTSVFGNGGTDTFRVGATASNGVRVFTGDGNDRLDLYSSAQPATAILSAGETLGAVTVSNTKRLVLADAGPRYAPVATSLDVNGTGRLELNRNGFVVNYPPLGVSPGVLVRADIVNARAGGTWLGDGITTADPADGVPQPALSVGYAESSAALGPTGGTFLGTPADASAVLVRATRDGDANLDGSVNFPDLLALSGNYNTAPARWDRGDSNYDGSVSFPDLLALSGNYNTSLPAVAAARSLRPLGRPVGQVLPPHGLGEVDALEVGQRAEPGDDVGELLL